MSAVVRPATSDDRQELLHLLERNLGASQQLRFDWRHENNPAGRAWSWFLYDRNSRATVGMASVFPRRMRLEGKAVLCGQVGDFVIDPSYRSLGPAVMLQRATFQPVDAGALAFCYDCPPHDRGMSTFVRLKMRPNCELRRYVYLTRSDEYVKKKVGNGPWTKPLVLAANVALRMRKSSHRPLKLEICEMNARFDEEFTELDRLVSSAGVIRAGRSAEDLNWRYRDDPFMAKRASDDGYRVLVARRAGDLLGFVVFFRESESVTSIADLFGRQLEEIGPALLNEVGAICRRESLSAVHAYCSQEENLTSLFVDAGFHRRERAARVVAYAKAGDLADRALQDSSLRWPFTQVEMLV